MALLRLFERTGDARYREAASEAQAYERSVFSATAGNWPHFGMDAGNGEPSFMSAWCHGAPGIALARLGGGQEAWDDRCEGEVDVCIQTTQGVGHDTRDHLCCGNFGRIETLAKAGRDLRRPELLARAIEQATMVVNAARSRGNGCANYSIFEDLPGEAFSPGFFQGTTGIGYELLRLSQPDAYPSVLVWE